MSAFVGRFSHSRRRFDFLWVDIRSILLVKVEKVREPSTQVECRRKDGSGTSELTSGVCETTQLGTELEHAWNS